jgi:alkylation response protein AidB-like acyl-CoA dehydrogenase
MGTLLRHGSEAQKAAYLPKIASGELRLQAFGVTEPTSGTDTSSITTFARREGDGYVVDGQKIWTSRAEHSDLMLLLARTTPRDEVAKRTDGLSVFLVDIRQANEAGLTIRPIRTMMNHSTTEVLFDQVQVPADASWDAANACVQTYGGFAFAEEYDIERKFRETRLYQVAPISTNLIPSYLAEHRLGLQRSYQHGP